MDSQYVVLCNGYKTVNYIHLQYSNVDKSKKHSNKWKQFKTSKIQNMVQM